VNPNKGKTHLDAKRIFFFLAGTEPSATDFNYPQTRVPLAQSSPTNIEANEANGQANPTNRKAGVMKIRANSTGEIALACQTLLDDLRKLSRHIFSL